MRCICFKLGEMSAQGTGMPECPHYGCVRAATPAAESYGSLQIPTVKRIETSFHGAASHRMTRQRGRGHHELGCLPRPDHAPPPPPTTRQASAAADASPPRASSAPTTCVGSNPMLRKLATASQAAAKPPLLAAVGPPPATTRPSAKSAGSLSGMPPASRCQTSKACRDAPSERPCPAPFGVAWHAGGGNRQRSWSRGLSATGGEEGGAMFPSQDFAAPQAMDRHASPR